MAWSIPATWATSELVTAAKMNAQVRDNLAFYNPSRCIYETASAQSFTTAVTTIVRYDTVVEDDASDVTTGASWHFTCRYAGLHQVNAGLLWTTTTAWSGTNPETSEMYLYKNGASYRNLDWANPVSTAASSQFVHMEGSVMVRLAVNDTIDVRAVQRTGGNLVLHNDAIYNHVDIYRLGG